MCIRDRNPGARELQRTLAREVTRIVHGGDRLTSVERVTEVLFGRRDFHELSENDIQLLATEIPTAERQSLVDVLVGSGVCASNGDARRLIQAGAISINGQKIHEDTEITDMSLVKKGKNTFVLVR